MPPKKHKKPKAKKPKAKPAPPPPPAKAPTSPAPVGPSPSTAQPFPTPIPAAPLRVLRRVLVVTDTGEAPTFRTVTQLLRKAGVMVGAASVRFDSKTFVRSDLVSVVRAETTLFSPQAVLVGAPAADQAKVGDLVHALPRGVSVVWAEDPSPTDLSTTRLGAWAGPMLARFPNLSIVSPGSVLVGTTDLISADKLTGAGDRAYAQSLVDIVSSAFRLPRAPLNAAEVPDAAGLVAVAAAESRLGDKYVWGAAGPNQFDCSGLVMWAWAHAGVQLPHFSGAQYEMTVPVPMDALQPGDLLFPANQGEHVAMYAGNGWIIQATDPQLGVQLIRLKSTGHFFVHATAVVADLVVGQPSTSSVEAYALKLVRAVPGWGISQWPYLQALWDRESGWRVDATNPVSGAYGIPQALPGSKMASAGADWLTNPYTQIRWGLEYIAARYGSPQVAWAHEVQFSWY